MDFKEIASAVDGEWGICMAALAISFPSTRVDGLVAGNNNISELLFYNWSQTEDHWYVDVFEALTHLNRVSYKIYEEDI